MTKQIDKTSKQIELIKEKIYEANRIINILHFYTNINNESLTSEMLKEVVKECKDLISRDY